MTEPARAWPPEGRGVNSLVGGARKRTGPLEAVPAVAPPLRPLPTFHQGAATWRANPHLHYLADPDATRPPNVTELADYRARRTNPYDELAWLYRLDAEINRMSVPGPGEALRPGPGTAPAEDLPGPTGTDTAVSYG
ncbi:MAG TPA: hypothetical protein VGF32_21530 [Streptosporangiaceae bacterium]